MAYFAKSSCVGYYTQIVVVPLFPELYWDNVHRPFAAGCHPVGKSYAARVIGSVTYTLQTCVQDVELECVELIDTVMMAFRSTPHSATVFNFI